MFDLETLAAINKERGLASAMPSNGVVISS